jgi:hypothetical protein
MPNGQRTVNARLNGAHGAGASSVLTEHQRAEPGGCAYEQLAFAELADRALVSHRQSIYDTGGPKIKITCNQSKARGGGAKLKRSKRRRNLQP